MHEVNTKRIKCGEDCSQGLAKSSHPELSAPALRKLLKRGACYGLWPRKAWQPQQRNIFRFSLKL